MNIIRPIPNEKATFRYLFFHHAGGSALSYFKYASLLHKNAEFQILEFPGRNPDKKENWPCNWSEFKREFTSLAKQDSRPTILFGHSFGALIAYEIAAFFEENHLPLLGLGVSSLRAPTQTNLNTRVQISHLPIVEFSKKLVNYGAIDNIKTLTRTQQDDLLSVIKNDIFMMEEYAFSKHSKLTTTTHVFFGAEDNTQTQQEIQDWKLLVNVKSTTGFSGGHFFLYTHFQEILNKLKEFET